MEDFKVTSIDGEAIAPVAEVQSQEPTEVAPEQPPVQTQEANANEENTKEPEGEITAPAEVPETEAASFETTTVELDKPDVAEEVHKTDVAFDEPVGTDLLAFIEENKDLIGSYDKLNKNFDEMKDEALVEEHLKAKHPELSQTDINTLLEDYTFDEEKDTRTDIVKRKIAMSNAVEGAKAFLNGQKDLLTQELAKRNLGGPTRADIEQRQIRQDAAATFTTETDNFFNQGFEGFTFQLNDKQALNLKINNKDAVKTQQASIENFLKPYFDEVSGKITDPSGYHRAIFAATNIDAITRNAYEQGRADATSTIEKEAKNIDMTGRSTHESNPIEGTTWKIT